MIPSGCCGCLVLQCVYLFLAYWLAGWSDGEYMSEEIWDATKLSSYACEMRGHYAMEKHWQPKESSEALAFGIGFHKAVEVWTQTLTQHDDGPVIAIENAKLAFAEVWERELPQEKRDSLELLGDRRSYANFVRLFEAFIRKFPIEMFDKIVATETPFTLPLGRTPAGRDISWSGILDRAVIWQGGLYYVDIKTSSYPLDDRFFAQFRLSGQMTGYAWAGHELSLGNFDGVMIQGVEVKIPQDGIKLTKAGVPYAKQGRQVLDLLGIDIIPILPEHIEEWKADTLRKIDLIHAARELQHWIRNRGELCNSFNGCAFRRVCQAHPNAREAILQENYKQREWNPLERDA